MVLYGDGRSSLVWIDQATQCEIAQDGLHRLRLILEQLSGRPRAETGAIYPQDQSKTFNGNKVYLSY